MAEAGVPRDHIARVLNHVEGDPAATRTKSALQNHERPSVAQAFRPANGRRAALKGCATFNFATRSKVLRFTVRGSGVPARENPEPRTREPENLGILEMTTMTR